MRVKKCYTLSAQLWRGGDSRIPEGRWLSKTLYQGGESLKKTLNINLGSSCKKKDEGQENKKKVKNMEALC